MDFSSAGPFEKGRDSFALITLLGTTALLGHFTLLLDCARASIDASDFNRRLAKDGYLHKTARKYAEEIRTIVGAACEGGLVPEEDFWQFLKSIHVLSLDLGSATAQAEAWLRTLLAHTAAEANPIGTAEATWHHLLELAGSGMSAARKFTRSSLPESLRTKHRTIGTREHDALRTLKEHSAIILDGIRNTVGPSLAIARDGLVTQILERLEKDRILIISGPAGYGKSALAKAAFLELAKNNFSFAFRAEEFNAAHLDETLGRAKVDLTSEGLSAVLAAQGRKIILIESVERLLEASVRDSFTDLLRLANRDATCRLILTCRDYSVNVVRSSLLQHADAQHGMITVPALTDNELDYAVMQLPLLARPLGNPRLRSLLCNPYLLDKAARMDWPETQPLPEDEASFRKKFWSDVVREDITGIGGLPQRRAQAFIELALRRARAMSIFAPCADLDQEALTKLRSINLITVSESSDSLASPAHDVLEDWALIQWLEERFTYHERVPGPMAIEVGGHPAIRRAYRSWLGEQLERDATTGDEFVLASLRTNEIPAYFRDDTVVSTLLSSNASRFLGRHRALLLADDCALLRRVIHLLRVACRATPTWFPTGRSLPATLFVPAGGAWAPVLELVTESLGQLIPKDIPLLVGLIQDWSGSVTWWSPYPPGAKEAAAIAYGVLPHLDNYGQDTLQKKTFQVLAKIPKADSAAFLALLDRAGQDDRQDYLAREFAALLFEGIDGGFACRDFPDAMMACAERLFCLTEADLRGRTRFSSSMDIGPFFGIREDITHDFFPSSAMRGPFAPLLRWHPDKGVDFILRFLNHAGRWYSERKWPGFRLEGTFDAHIQVAQHGQVVQQANGRFWALFRGMSVGPYVLQCALMALEAWLLEQGSRANPHLESWLLKCLTDSKNVAVTAVVASVCNAYPHLAGKAAPALLTCQDFFELDRRRLIYESSTRAEPFLPSIGVENTLYENERRQSALLDHRKHDLEALALRLQLTVQREAVWEIIDRYRSELPIQKVQTDEDRLWRLVLHRIDIRGFQATESPATPSAPEEQQRAAEPEKEERKATYYVPGPVDSDIQEMIESALPGQERKTRDLTLLNWGVAAWSREKDAEPSKWREMLEAARARCLSPEDSEEFYGGGPGFIAAVCVRDHWDELSPAIKEWCVEQLIKCVECDSDNYDQISRVSRSVLDPSRPAAFVLPKLLGVIGSKGIKDRLAEAVAKALTHPMAEVVSYASEGVARCDRAFVVQCVGAMARKANLLGELIARQQQHPNTEQREVSALELSITPVIRRMIVEGGADPEVELKRLDLHHWTGQEAMKVVLTMLGKHIEEPLAIGSYRALTRSLVERWNEDRRDRGNRKRTRNFQFEHEALRRIASGVIRLPADTALDIYSPLLEAAEYHARDVAGFVQELVIAENSYSGSSSFWSIWDAFAQRILQTRWVSELRSWRHANEPELLSAMFLAAPWEDGTHHWPRLEGFAQKLDSLFLRLPECPVALEAYTRFLYTIGRRSLPGGFVLIAERLRGDSPVGMVVRGNVVFYLESLLRLYVYGEPHRIKSNPEKRKAALLILDVLVEAGSSAAYRMRDDFVTPLSRSNR